MNENTETIPDSAHSGDNVYLSNDNVTPIESMTSSTNSLNLFQETPIQAQEYTDCSQPSNIVNNDTNYFNTALFQGNEANHILSNYFDNAPKFSNNTETTNQNKTESQIENISEPINLQSAEFNDLANVEPVEAINDSFKCQNIYEDNTKSEDVDPEIKFGSSSNVSNAIVTPAVISSTESAFVNNAAVENIQDKTQKTTYSSAESLRQLSSQINSLIDLDNIPSFTGSSELERRNQELASLLDKEQQKTDQLNLQLREYVTRVSQLETEAQQTKNEYEARLSREIGPLQEQLQYHIQTFGILVGEKTELSTSLNQSQATVKQKTAECEELQSRLRASRHRVNELEKEVNSLKAVKVNVDKNVQEHNREIERLKLEYGMLKDQFTEVSDESTEVKEKLNMKTNELLTLQQELQEKNSQLSLAQLRIQQLTVGENLQIESQLETLNQQKISLEQQIADLTQTVKLVSSERDQASQQYQQYVQQLNAQLQNLAGQLEEKNKDNESLSKREQSLVKHIGELEKHLQQLQSEKLNMVPAVEDTSPRVKEMEDNIHAMEKEMVELNKKCSEESSRKDALEKELSEKNVKMEEMEFKLEQMMSEQPDTAKLLAAMESDKIAASRATEQNQKLKTQLEELQDAFIQMVIFNFSQLKIVSNEKLA